ncbi:MAG: hypothetical protein V3S69_02595 [Dehalococcoidales bacterium]
MTVIVSKQDEAPPVRGYPKLMRSIENSTIVLMSGLDTGVVVVTSAVGEQVGHFSGRWTTSRFENYFGTITLTNQR